MSRTFAGDEGGTDALAARPVEHSEIASDRSLAAADIATTSARQAVLLQDGAMAD